MTKNCVACRLPPAQELDFTMAFQPIVDLSTGHVWGYEALVRGPGGASAASVLDRVDDTNRYWFDQACRVKAIELAAKVLPGQTKLSINFMPNAVYEPRACIRATLEAAARTGFDPRRLMFEFTENERMPDPEHTARIIDAYRRMGFLTALDDFGAGHAGLGLLARFQPDVIKLDMELIRDVDTSRARQAIVEGLAVTAERLGVRLLAEGIETEAEIRALAGYGITLAQGYLFARPAVEAAPPARVLAL